MWQSLKFLFKKKEFWAAVMNWQLTQNFHKIIAIERLKKKFIYMWNMEATWKSVSKSPFCYWHITYTVKITVLLSAGINTHSFHFEICFLKYPTKLG